MNYKVIKSGFDGISGGSSTFDSIDEAISELSYHKGWDTLEQMRDSIRKWSKSTSAGDTFCTQVSCIVAVGIVKGIDDLDECPKCEWGDLEYDEIEPQEDGGASQIVWCPKCRKQWKDVFLLAARHDMSNRKN